MKYRDLFVNRPVKMTTGLCAKHMLHHSRKPKTIVLKTFFKAKAKKMIRIFRHHGKKYENFLNDNQLLEDIVYPDICQDQEQPTISRKTKPFSELSKKQQDRRLKVTFLKIYFLF